MALHKCALCWQLLQLAYKCTTDYFWEYCSNDALYFAQCGFACSPFPLFVTITLGIDSKLIYGITQADLDSATQLLLSCKKQHVEAGIPKATYR